MRNSTNIFESESTSDLANDSPGNTVLKVYIDGSQKKENKEVKCMGFFKGRFKQRKNVLLMKKLVEYPQKRDKCLQCQCYNLWWFGFAG